MKDVWLELEGKFWTMGIDHTLLYTYFLLQSPLGSGGRLQLFIELGSPNPQSGSRLCGKLIRDQRELYG